MKSQPPLTKVELIEYSLRCWALGLWGLLPLIGIPMAVRALILYSRAKQGQGDMWNPAHRQLFWGGVFARMSLTITIVIGLPLAAAIYLSSWRT